MDVVLHVYVLHVQLCQIFICLCQVELLKFIFERTGFAVLFLILSRPPLIVNGCSGGVGCFGAKMVTLWCAIRVSLYERWCGSSVWLSLSMLHVHFYVIL